MTMAPNSQFPAPRRSVAGLWVAVAILAVLVAGGLIALFTLGGGNVQPSPGTPSASVSSFSPAPDLPDLTEEQYPAEVDGWIRGWTGTQPVYDKPDGSTRMIIVSHGPAVLSMADEMELMGFDATELAPGVFCYPSDGRTDCRADTASGRRFEVSFKGTVEPSPQETADWFAEFIAGIAD